MITATKTMYTETGHRLLDYDGKCAHLHGHSYRWEITAGCATLNKTGFVVDFKDLKAAMRPILDHIDHSFIFHHDDPLYLRFKADPRLLRATNGDVGRIIGLPYNPTAENLLALLVIPEIDRALPPHIRIVRGRVWETANSYAEVQCLPPGV